MSGEVRDGRRRKTGALERDVSLIARRRSRYFHQLGWWGRGQWAMIRTYSVSAPLRRSVRLQHKRRAAIPQFLRSLTVSLGKSDMGQ